MKYRIGLDIGIGSVGWSVISAEEEGHRARIEDFGTRIFESGENPKTSESLCKGRRVNRGIRRLERRCSYRKKLLKNHFRNIGLICNTFNDDMAECKDEDVYLLKVKALNERITTAQLYKCLVHTCNHRGYRDFYEPDLDDEEAGMNASAANVFEKSYLASGQRTVSEYLLAEYYDGNFVKYRNRAGGDVPYMLIRRDLLKEEIKLILNKQSEYYPALNECNIEQTITIIFNQRDFEDGPGDPTDSDRRYHGFIETLGTCPFYRDEKRGFRGTVISDIFAVTNTLSQYRFVNIETGEYELNKNIAVELIDKLLINASLSKKDVNNILKAHGYKMLAGENTDDKAFSKAAKYLPLAKHCIEESGYKWSDVISEEQLDLENTSLLHRIGELISTYQTPKRRVKEMKAAGIDDKLINAFSGKKISGTASCSYKYMCDAIHAFLSGDIYGNFQSNFIKKHEEKAPIEKSYKLLLSHIDDSDVHNNRVVFKAINETRKIVNAIIETYGSPTEIVVEVASELGKSVQMRNEEQERQKKSEKENDRVKKEIASLLSIEETDVKGHMIERYKLFKEQEGKSAYSLKPLGDLKAVVENANREYEIDHIVPYSLILDNTLNNKALVFTSENQGKRQRTPLMYLGDEKGKAFLAFVNHMYSRKENPISKKKLEYYRLETLYSDEAKQLLSDWKSRNINDTRYITKYIAGILEKYLIFAGNKKQHVQTVKGAVTQKFRREWFRGSKWGEEEKCRETYLNHALDAVIAANLTKPYIEIGSDALRLISIYKYNKSKITPEYTEYFEKCIDKMEKYYGFDREYTRKMLSNTGRVPSYVPRLFDEVDVRFNDSDEKAFEDGVQRLYQGESDFIVPPHIPITSHKQNKKFKGTIADSNPVRIVTIDGETYKIKRTDVTSLSRKQLDKLYTDDRGLIEQLHGILDGKDEKYTVENYLKESGLRFLTLSNGTVIRKVSLKDKFSNFYKVDKGDGNFTNLGVLKYYCVEIYKNGKGETKTCGIRFVDVVKKNGKLYRKSESRPEDYASHIMYLFAGDYVRIVDRNNTVKFEGFYKSVKTIGRSEFNFQKKNNSSAHIISILPKDKILKYDVSILGKLGGEIKCSEPLPYITESESP